MILATNNSYLLYVFLCFTYVCGVVCIPLMENDSAQHATMAMSMYLENDFLTILKGRSDYLDKPHMHFWLAALSFKIFGVYDWSYRLPALMFTLLGAIYTNKLAVHFYGKKVQHIASLIFVSAQAVILSNHDVRTDAVLTGATAMSLYYFVKYLDTQKVKCVILGFLGLAIGFSTKGQLAVFVCGVCLLVFVWQYNKWKVVFSYKTIIGLFCYGIFITPVLYAYYLQFDLHPNKIFNGVNNVSGVKFILWDQCFNRLSANGFQKTSPDYLFFFHTILWAFLPWSVFMYLGMWNNIKGAIKNRFKSQNKLEIMSSLGVLLVLLVISTSKFKLPHYLNSLLPLMSVLVTGYFVFLYQNNKESWSKKWLFFQIALLSVLAVFVLFVSVWAFPLEDCLFLLIPLVVIVWLFSYLFKENTSLVRKLIVASVGYMVLINLFLNLHFYPNLLRYQSGIVASSYLLNKNIVADKVKLLDGTLSWSLNFYLNKMLTVVNKNEVQNLEVGDWLYLKKEPYEQLKKQGIVWDKVLELSHYRITRLKPKFLNPNTRDQVLDTRYLVRK